MRITLDKTRLQALVIAVPLVIVVAAGLYYFYFVRPTYGVFHEPLMAQDTAVRVVLKPVLVQSYVSSLAHTATKFIKGIPKVSSMQQFAFNTEWIHKMPFEFSFLFDQRSPEYLGVLLFVREHPTSESFASLVNGSGFFNDLHPIDWEQDRMAREGAGQLVSTGTLPIPVATRNVVSDAFPNYVPFDAPPVTGRHFIEIAVDNSNGALMELHGALSRAVVPWADPTLERNMYQVWPFIEQVQITADLEADDTLVFRADITCADGDAADVIGEVVETAGAAAGRYLEGRHDFQVSGRADAVGNKVTAEYTLSGFESKLRRALGG
jgi:hypothetical protein